jgi:hypothetical protein
MGTELAGGLTQEAMAAWAQAILSGVAILIAVLLPWRQARAEQRRRLDLYCEVFGRLESRCYEAEAGLLVDGVPGTIAEFFDIVPDGSWLRLGAVFDEMPRQDVPDARLIFLLDQASDLVHDCRATLERVRAIGTDDSVRRAAGEIRQHAESAAQLAEWAREVRWEYGGGTVRRLKRAFRINTGLREIVRRWTPKSERPKP